MVARGLECRDGHTEFLVRSIAAQGFECCDTSLVVESTAARGFKYCDTHRNMNIRRVGLQILRHCPRLLTD